MRFAPTASLALLASVLVLAGCPEERPDAKRPLPRDRLPPAMSIQPRRDVVAPLPPGTSSRAPGAPGTEATTTPAATPTPMPPTTTATPAADQRAREAAPPTR